MSHCESSIYPRIDEATCQPLDSRGQACGSIAKPYPATYLHAGVGVRAEARSFCESPLRGVFHMFMPKSVDQA